jgi:hypothetical protein
LESIAVRAFEDHERPEGGHAVVLFEGLDALPEDVTFEIRPADEFAGNELPEGWPSGRHAPVAVRSSGEGVELVIGPEVADSERLWPGLAVAIEIAEADVRGEFIWPDIAPLRRPRRRTLSINPQARDDRVTTMPKPALADSYYDDELDEDEAGLIETAPRAPVPAAEPPRAAATTADPVGVGAERATAAAEQASARMFRDAVIEPRNDNPRSAGAAPVAQAAPAAAAAASQPAPAAEAGPAANPGRGRGELSSQELVRLREEAYAAQATLSRLREPGLGRGTHAPSLPDIHDMPTNGGQEQPAFEQRASSRERSRSAMGADHGEYRNDAGGGSFAKSVLVAGLAAVIGAGAASMLLAPERVHKLLGSEPVAVADSGAGAASTQSAADQVVGAADDAPGAIFEALQAGDASPRGVTAAGLSQAQVLDNANQIAVPGNSEGAFWRKRYIVNSLASDRTRRALTQLGSLYAEPTGHAPDFAKARMVWELASAAGDPVAMCFLGQLHENGLSVAADKKAALTWYERAKSAGGCPSVDASIARVKR